MPDQATEPPSRALSLVAAILDTRDVEIDCDRFASIVSEYVDVEVGGGDPASVDAGLPLHARMCPECAELYRALVFVAGLEVTGALPHADALFDELKRVAVDQGIAVEAAVPVSPAIVPSVPAAAATTDGSAATKPARTRSAPARSGAGRRDAWWDRWRWTMRPLAVAAAGAAVVALVFLGLNNRDSSSAMQVRQGRIPSGETLSVSFRPDSEQFELSADRPSDAMKKLRCWLVDGSGVREQAKLDWERQKEVWTGWVKRPMSDYVALSVVAMPEETEIARISLR